MKAIVLGAGRIGRGFVSSLLLKNGVDIHYFDVSNEMVDLLNEQGHYTIHVLGHSDLDIENPNVTADLATDAHALAEAWKEADFIFTACGGKNMPSVGHLLGNAFKVLYAMDGVHTSNIVTCENWIDPDKDLIKAVLEVLNEEERTAFLDNTGIAESVILCTGTGAPDPSIQHGPADTWIQNFPYLPIDRAAIKGEIPQWEFFDFAEGFGNMLTQKLYTNNTACGSGAYLGSLKGCKLMSEAANDPEIEPILDEIYGEINYALIHGLNIPEDSQLAFQRRARAKYRDRDIVDPLTRIARDPIRKLGSDDRLIGPAKIALKAGKEPKAIAMAAAAALYYENPEDESAVRLQQMRKEHGNEYILQTISGLSPDEPLYSLILEGVEELKKKGWIHE